MTTPSALTLDAARPQELARFWAALLDWHLTEPTDEGAAASAAPAGPPAVRTPTAPASSEAVVGAGPDRFAEQQDAAIDADVESAAGGTGAATVLPGRSVGGLASAAAEGQSLGVGEAPGLPGVEVEPDALLPGPAADRPPSAAAAVSAGRDSRAGQPEARPGDQSDVADPPPILAGGQRRAGSSPAQGLVAPTVRPPAEDGCEFDLVFVPEAEPKVHKNRLHLDLASRTPEHQREVVERARSLGARHLDLGQGDVPWVVLADPEGNEFCVLEPRPEYDGSGALAALVVDTREPARLAEFWSELIGWPITADQGPQIVGVRSPSGRGPAIEFLSSTDTKRGRNRLRLELAAGADPLSPKQDPEGNEFSHRQA
ncbi:VOC family protein [Amycolatopsis sp. NPDC001319]|uniref:VOC family protein n=1 Tax=unclassified Amycolatopsis TaxID=2618356 RepID=UPI0036936B7B